MDERNNIFTRFHEALDVEPPAGAYDRLRFAFTSSPVVLAQRPGFRMRFTRMGFRVAAAVVVAVVVLVALLTYVSLHHPTVGTIPAHPGQDIRPYQALIARDYQKTFSSEIGSSCNTIADPTCQATLARFLPNVQSWLQDLSNINPPDRFKQIDAMLRTHLAEAVAAGNAAVAAQKAGSTAVASAALTVHLTIRAFIVDLASAVADTHVVSAATYSTSLSDQADLLTSCSPCAKYLAGPPVTCVKAQLLTCVDEVMAVDAQVFEFEFGVVKQSAPASLVAKDANLQKDLVGADAALVSMATAAISGDAATYDSAATTLQTSMAAIVTDLAALR